MPDPWLEPHRFRNAGFGFHSVLGFSCLALVVIVLSAAIIVNTIHTIRQRGLIMQSLWIVESDNDSDYDNFHAAPGRLSVDAVVIENDTAEVIDIVGRNWTSFAVVALNDTFETPGDE